MPKDKRMDIKEFREFGFLQEVNRMFLHPMGLSLEVLIDDDSGEEFLGGIWDCRDDPEGIFFNIKNSSEEKKKQFAEKLNRVKKHADTMASARVNKWGFVIEPVGEE